MQEDPHANPLVKEVAGHLFHFEEKIFGMSLTQLLTDLGVLTGSFSLTGSLPLVPRIVVCALIMLCAMIMVHGKVYGMSLAYWCYLLLRSKMMPSWATWQSSGANQQPSQKKEKRPPSVQTMWIPIDALEQGIAEKHEQHKHMEHTRFWTVFEIEGKNIGLFTEREQLRVFRRFESFLTGLSFHLQFVSLTEQIDPETVPALKRQKEALRDLAAIPRLQSRGARTADAHLYPDAAFHHRSGIQYRSSLSAIRWYPPPRACCPLAPASFQHEVRSDACTSS
jgi:hypothetical protein